MFIRAISRKQIYIIALFLLIVSIIFYCIFHYPIVIPSSSAPADTIKWVNFDITSEVLDKTATLDISSHKNNDPVLLDWISLLAYLGCKYGGNFNQFKQSDLDSLVQKLKDGASMESLTQNLKSYDYYYSCYNAVLSRVYWGI